MVVRAYQQDCPRQSPCNGVCVHVVQRNNASLSGGGIRLENGLNNSALIRNSSFLANTASVSLEARRCPAYVRASTFASQHPLHSADWVAVKLSCFAAVPLLLQFGGAVNMISSNTNMTIQNSTLQVSIDKAIIRVLTRLSYEAHVARRSAINL